MFNENKLLLMKKNTEAALLKDPVFEKNNNTEFIIILQNRL